jgi:hypothetical protein
VITDPLVDVAVRVHGDFSEHATLTQVLAIIEGCRRDLDSPSAAAMPELVERLARQRLTDQLAAQDDRAANTATNGHGSPRRA